MQTTIYTLRKQIKHTKIILVALIFILTSCFYSGKYIANYTIQNKQTVKNAKEISIDFINQLAKKNLLSTDSRFNGIDTLGFFGRPYHYFKFWFEQRDSNTIVILDYYGNFGSRKNQPYRDFFIELNDFLKENFIILEQEIVEENNARTKK
jgi:hypothetical protein